MGALEGIQGVTGESMVSEGGKECWICSFVTLVSVPFRVWLAKSGGGGVWYLPDLLVATEPYDGSDLDHTRPTGLGLCCCYSCTNSTHVVGVVNGLEGE